MTVTPFSQALRERTWSSHGDTESATFMSDLMSGKGTRDDYIALVVQHFYIYEALEGVEKQLIDNPIASRFITPRLTRLPAIEADLEFLIGADWHEQSQPLRSTQRYVDRIREIGATWPGGFIAHHYTRYLGDLSGGQHIYKVMQKRFGFDTNGIGFYLFDGIADPTEFKNVYRSQLDAAEWDADESARIIDEVVRAYELNADVFRDLSAAKVAA
jgi:heme oxygenase